MKFLVYFFTTISILLFILMGYNLIRAHQPGIFPTKIVLRQRVGVLAVSACFCLLLAILLSIIK